MLSPADAAVVARDPAVPALPVLLDGEVLSGLLGAPVHRDYLRYKPGTSCVLGGRVELASGTADMLVTAYDVAGGVKIDKTVADAPRGAVLHVDRARGLVAVLASADRDLPLLGALADDKHRRRAMTRLLPGRPGLAAARVSTLSYKPMRRWVGLLTPAEGPPVVLRAYRPVDLPRAAEVVRELGAGAPCTPRLLGVDAAVAALAVEWLEGRPLDALLACDAVSGAQLEQVGHALAALHGRCMPALGARTPEADVAAVRAAAEQVALLLPALAAQAGRLADELTRRFARIPTDRALVHGDFSPDQVVLGPRGVGLLDLDRAAVGDAAGDLAGLVAASIAEPAGTDALARVRDGYAAERTLPTEESVRTHVSALLLRRVVEPFRRCRPGWEQRAQVLLDAAVEALPGPLACAVDDLVAPAVGGVPAWEVLKDKPGRRRTSRASGPGGTAIVKVYASGRAPVVARRVRALQDGPAEPVLPRVLGCDEARHVVVLSEVPGRPFREAVLAGDTAAAARVGRALAAWHDAHRGRLPSALRPHSAAREREVLIERCAAAPPAVADAVRRALPREEPDWPADTVVHRDLYEDQIVLGHRVGLLDLDDAALGPAELDVGNLLAHLDLLGRRAEVAVAGPRQALLGAYTETARLDGDLLERCWRLSVLRLACVHADPLLLDLLPEPDVPGTSALAASFRAGDRDGAQ